MALLIEVCCAVGFVAAVSPTVDHFLSNVFLVVFVVAGAVALIAVLVVEVRDWSEWMRITGRPVHPPRAPAREEARER